MQDTRLNWFKAIFSTSSFEILVIPYRDDYNLDKNDFGVYKLPKSETDQKYERFWVALNGNISNQLELNVDEFDLSVQEPFIRKKINLQDNYDLTCKFLVKGLEKQFTLQEFEAIPRFRGIGIYNPSERIRFGDFLEGYELFTIIPYYLRSAHSFGIIVNSSFRVTFCRSLVEPKLREIFQHEQILFLNDNNDKIKGRIRDIDEKTAVVFDKEGTIHEVALNKIYPVYSFEALSTYSNELGLPSNIVKEILKYSKSLNKFDKDNTFIYADKLESIRSFILRNKEILQNFELPTISELSIGIDINFQQVEYTKIPARVYLFGKEAKNTDYSQYKGIQKFGTITEVKEKNPHFIMVFDDKDKDLANKLFLSLKNGIGYFPGIKKFFDIEINKYDLAGVRVNLTDEELNNHIQIAQKYSEAIITNAENFPKNKNLFAFLIIPKTPSYLDPSPYYACKATLIKLGIPSQAVDRNLIMNPENLKWAIGNIVLAAFAKMGGVPWKVRSNRKNDLIIGVGRSDIYDSNRNFVERVVGYTICFSPDGEFQSFNIMEPANKTEYLEKLKSAIKNSLEFQLERDENIERIIIHFPKRSGKDEVNAIESGIRQVIKEGPLLPYIILRITSEDSFQAFDFNHNSKTPLEGTCIQIAPKDALIWLEGRPHNRTLSKKPSNPIRISLERTNIPWNQIRFSELIEDVNNLAGANWRGFNAKAKPITIYYSKLIAGLMSHLFQNLDSNDIKRLNVQDNLPWFI